jgi:hypothetical protein
MGSVSEAVVWEGRGLGWGRVRGEGVRGGRFEGEGMGEAEFAEHGGFLGLMCLHAAQDIVEGADGFEDMGALVEHDAFGAVAHGGVGDFGAGGHSLFCEGFEDLGGPDDGDMGSLADPEDFLLNFGESFEAAFDGEVAASDHDAAARPGHGGEEHIGEVIEAAFGFDFEDDGWTAIGEPGEMLLEELDIACGIGEGEFDDIGIMSGEFEVLEVSGGEGGELERGFGEVDAFIGLEFRACGSCVGDADEGVGGVDLLDDAADFSVIEPDGVTGPDVFEDIGDGAADHGGREDAAGVIEGGGPTGLEVAGDEEGIAFVEGEGVFAVGQGTDGSGSQVSGEIAVDEFEENSGDEVGGLVGLCPGALASDIDDLEGARGMPRVTEADAVAGLEVLEPIVGEWEGGIGGRGRGRGMALVCEPDARGRGDASQRIALGSDADDGGSGFDGSGAKLGTGEIHDDAAGAAERLPSAFEVVDDERPGLLVIVSAIDPHAIHALAEEVADEGVVMRGLARHGDHDADAAAMDGRAEEVVRMFGEESLTVFEEDGGVMERARVPGDAREVMQGLEDGIDGGEDVGFGAAERREAEGCEAVLEWSQVVAAEGQVVQEIASTFLEAGMNGIEQVMRRGVFGDEFGADGFELMKSVMDVWGCRRRGRGWNFGDHRDDLRARRGMGGCTVSWGTSMMLSDGGSGTEYVVDPRGAERGAEHLGWRVACASC